MECYRVIIVTSAAVAGVADLSKIEFYINMMEKTEYEFRLIDMPNKDAAVIIVGMREAVEEKLGQELRRMANVIENSTGEKVCFYVGGKYRELGRIYSSYAQACACIREEGERKGGQIVYYNSERKKEGNPPYPKAELNALYDALTGAELYEAFAVTDRLLDILKEYQNNRFASITLYYDVLNTYYRAWAKLDIDMESEFLETDLLEIRDNLEAIQILQRIREQYAAYVGRIRGKDSDGSSDDKRRSRSQVKKTEEAKKDDLILRIVSFIDENRKSCDLCVSMVADYFNMSISHMSHKFKKQMNRTISDYITEKKFDYVRELLLETDYSIKEISFMAGYSHPVSFIYKFRQLYGMTPVEYRTANKKI